MNTNETETGLRECNKAIRRISHNLKIAVTMGEKQRLSAALANIESYRSQIKNLRKKGRGLKETAKNHVLWQDSLLTFNSRIHTRADRVHTEFKYFTTSNSPIYKDSNIGLWFDEKVIKPILNELEEFQERDSEWSLKQVINLGVNISKFTPQLGSSYIDLPPQIKKRSMY
ncbi:unnamed protein product [Psylliodes chrysocephalus]|uniref:Uncharacterized protein n=1 Tax=Psylliodes chrysocephalus TaxID=3402493 RepID=A0A9P0GDW8_9CUCU|nr:unnamed protein product [Psylliodes chrysocephala]